MARLILDAGALIAGEARDRRAWGIKRDAHMRGVDVVVPAPVLAQLLRQPAVQAQLARFLAGTSTLPFTEESARRAGLLLASTGTRDVVDASVAVAARDGDAVVTSDRDDIRALTDAAGLSVVVIPV